MTISDIAKAAGVSPAVVSRVVNQDKTLRIAQETRARVQKAIDELDYAPNAAARSLRSASTGLIAMVVHDVTNPVYGEILRGAQQTAGALGKAIIVSDGSHLDDRASRLLALIGGNGVDGLILQAGGMNSDLVLARAGRQSVPTVLLQAALDTNAHLVCLPDARATQIATDYLLSLGHRRIGCLATGEGLTFTRNREAGWRDAMRQANQPVDENSIAYGQPSIEDGRASATGLIDTNPQLTALLCFNVVAAIGALQAAREKGLRVPDDLSIVAVHDIELADHLSVPLTTVAMPLFEMGARAVELVSDKTTGIDGTSIIDTSDPELVIRASAAPPSH